MPSDSRDAIIQEDPRPAAARWCRARADLRNTCSATRSTGRRQDAVACSRRSGARVTIQGAPTSGRAVLKFRHSRTRSSSRNLSAARSAARSLLFHIGSPSPEDESRGVRDDPRLDPQFERPVSATIVASRARPPRAGGEPGCVRAELVRASGPSRRPPRRVSRMGWLAPACCRTVSRARRQGAA